MYDDWSVRFGKWCVYIILRYLWLSNKGKGGIIEELNCGLIFLLLFEVRVCIVGREWFMGVVEVGVVQLLVDSSQGGRRRRRIPPTAKKAVNFQPPCTNPSVVMDLLPLDAEGVEEK